MLRTIARIDARSNFFDPQNIALPSVSRSGSTLTCTPGVWSAGSTVTRQWTRNGIDIAGATGTNYTLLDADYGALFAVREIATNGSGSNSATSIALFVGVQDVLSVAPAAVYGLQKFSGSYTGPAVIVRRDVNPATQNIDFAPNGQVDATALLTFTRAEARTMGTASTNLATFSNESRIANGVAGTILELAGTGAHQTSFPVTMPGGQVTVSFWVARGVGTRNLFISVTRAAGQLEAGSVDLSTGTFAVVTQTPTCTVTAQVRNGVSGWNIVFVTSTSTLNFAGTVTLGLLSGTTQSYAGDGTSTLIVSDLGAYAGSAGPNGFITQYFDQTGNGNHCSQATSTNQHQIVRNGLPVVSTINGVDTYVMPSVFNAWYTTTASLAPVAFYSAFGPCTIPAGVDPTLASSTQRVANLHVQNGNPVDTLCSNNLVTAAWLNGAAVPSLANYQNYNVGTPLSPSRSNMIFQTQTAGTSSPLFILSDSAGTPARGWQGTVYLWAVWTALPSTADRTLLQNNASSNYAISLP